MGIAVFAVLTINQLEAGPSNNALPTDFGTSSAASTPPAPANSVSPLAGIAQVDPSKFIPIMRKNPHPGQIPPFLRADPYGQMPYQQAAAGEVWEFCAYRVNDASLTDLIAHYNEQAKLADMKLVKQKPASENMPGGVVVSWSDGRRGLEVTAAPLGSTKPAAPPLRPDTPLQWVVKYSYPSKAQ